MRILTRRRGDDHHAPGLCSVHEMFLEAGGRVVAREDHLNCICGPAEALLRRTGIRRCAVHVGEVAAVWEAELDERVGELAGGEGCECGGRR